MNANGHGLWHLRTDMGRPFRRLRKNLRRLPGRCHIDPGDYRKSVLLAGSGRSGTTWVEDLINHSNEYRTLFEPFHSRNLAILKDWNYKQYLREDNADEVYLKPAAAILSGQVRCEWVDKFNRKIIVRKRLIKDIRANLFLKWIHRHFSEIPIILLLRHPCAVANSRVKLNWDCRLDDLLVQEDLMTDHLAPFEQQIRNAAEPFERHVFMWCVENYVPLKQFSAGEILIVFYEDVCQDPQREMERMMSFLGNQFSASAGELAAKPSALSRDESAVQRGANLVEAWRDHVDDRQLARAVEICRSFGLDRVYNEGSLPRLSGDEVLSVFGREIVESSPARYEAKSA